MRKLFFFFLSVSFLFFACNNDDITVTLNQSGTLTVSVIDENQNGMANVEVFIEDYDFGLTDESGTYRSQTLLQGVHHCSTSVKEGKVTYYETKRVQVLAGEDRKLELSPFTNTGELSIKIISWNTGQPVEKLNIALTNHSSWDETLANIIEDAHFVGQTNYNGIVEFKKVPANNYYRVVLYDDTMNWYQDNSYAITEKGEKVNFVFSYHD